MDFWGITPDMAVAEVNPGGGWYSRILAPMLRDKGLYVGLEHHPDMYAEAENYAARLRQYPTKLAANRSLYGDRAIGGWIPSRKALPVDPGSLDAVIVVRAMHNWVRENFFDQALGQSWKMLKVGGILGVVQHRADETAYGDRHATTRKGRWKQQELIDAIQAYGFKLIAVSEINANPKDTKDHPLGVWTLPPVLMLKDRDREKYLAIGESDRMTLKFVKLAN